MEQLKIKAVVEIKPTSNAIRNMEIAKEIKQKREALNYNGITVPRW